MKFSIAPLVAALFATFTTLAVAAAPESCANIKLGELSRELGKAKPGTSKGGKRGGTNELPHAGKIKAEALAKAGISKSTAQR